MDYSYQGEIVTIDINLGSKAEREIGAGEQKCARANC